MELQDAITVIDYEQDFQVFRRVPEFASMKTGVTGQVFHAAIIDLETTGLDSNKDEIPSTTPIGRLDGTFEG
jgi:hypothetical protein